MHKSILQTILFDQINVIASVSSFLLQTDGASKLLLVDGVSFLKLNG